MLFRTDSPTLSERAEAPTPSEGCLFHSQAALHSLVAVTIPELIHLCHFHLRPVPHKIGGTVKAEPVIPFACVCGDQLSIWPWRMLSEGLLEIGAVE